MSGLNWTQEKLNLHIALATIGYGLDQHVVAALYGVNQGRVNEATMAVRKAVADPVAFLERKIKQLEPTPLEAAIGRAKTTDTYFGSAPDTPSVTMGAVK